LTAYELALARGPVKLQSEYWRARYSGSRDAPAPITPYRLTLSAYYVELLWMVTGERFADAYRGGVFGRIRPKRGFDRRAGRWGALQLGVRYSDFDGTAFGVGRPAFTGRLAPPTTTTAPTNAAHAWTIGATWVANPFVRVLVNYVDTRFRTEVVSNGLLARRESAVVTRAQIDF
jgi:phosphate-selective porin OprO/OprP